MKREFTLLMMCACVSCATAEDVSRAGADYMKSVYGRNFVVMSVDMNRNEGNWGSADLRMHPENDPSLPFSLIYDYSAERVSWEDYKNALWERGLAREFPVDGTSFRIEQLDLMAGNSLALDSSKLPFREEWREIVPMLSSPRITLRAAAERDGPQAARALARTAAHLISAFGFERIVIEVAVRETRCSVIRFMLTKEYPQISDGALAHNSFPCTGATIPAEVMLLFRTAEESYARRDTVAALKHYAQVMQWFDPYRYEPYVVIRSAYQIESAYRCANILEASGRTREALPHWRRVEWLLRYEEARQSYDRWYREALQRIADDT